MEQLKRIGVDIAKPVFHVHGVDAEDRPRWTTKLKRDEWIAAVCERLRPDGEVGMEARASAHHWARILQARGSGSDSSVHSS